MPRASRPDPPNPGFPCSSRIRPWARSDVRRRLPCTRPAGGPLNRLGDFVPGVRLLRFVPHERKAPAVPAVYGDQRRPGPFGPDEDKTVTRGLVVKLLQALAAEN